MHVVKSIEAFLSEKKLCPYYVFLEKKNRSFCYRQVVLWELFQRGWSCGGNFKRFLNVFHKSSLMAE